MPKTMLFSEGLLAQRTFMEGDLIDDALLIELLSWLQQSKRQTCLTLMGSDEGPTQNQPRPVKLYLERGEIAYVNSRTPHHRLGAILLRRGVISELQLHQVLSQSRGRRIGEALIAHNIITRDELIAALRDQALIILHFALTTPKYLNATTSHDEGQTYTENQSKRFSRFTLSSYHPVELPLHLHIEVQGLLLEVLRQQDEVRALLPSMPPLRACPRAQRRARDDDAPEVIFALQQSGGTTPLKTLIFMNPISALEALKLYRDLLTDGSLAVTESWIPPEEQSIPPAVQNVQFEGDDEWFDLSFTPDGV